jgi:carboxyl-terminal processing protease
MNKRFQFAIVTTSTCLMVLLMLGTVLERGQAQDEDSTYRHFAVFSDVIRYIKRDYVEEPDMKNVTLGALNGLLESIDPYASYLSSDQYKQYLKSKETKQADVGLLLSRRAGYVSIIDAIPGSPADAQGLATDDIIEAINGISTRDMPLAYAEILLQGQAGSSVDLTVLRVRQGSDPQKVALVRSPIKYPAVLGNVLSDGIGYLKVTTLETGKLKEVSDSLKDLERKGAKKLVLDLRHNSTGTPADGIALANLFVDKGVLTYLQGQKVPKKIFPSNPAAAIAKMPLTVIVNRGTACGAEIAASAILDNKRGEVIGQRTYGCGHDSKAITMDDGSAVILSVAKYYMASGKTIQDNGVVPSIQMLGADVADDDDDEVAAPAPKAPQPQIAQPKADDDSVLRKAIEVLTIGADAAKSSMAPQPKPAVTTANPPPITTPGR